ncbi:hypothetical protein AX774_g733 [Zancudomyces culisetae]|uniref:TATA-binding protein interacting (TIP20) domain-containing protein n=1 Tax=Zancudomyces culisetae TaxID=1213189 RepID=A0A1R1PXN2_ZANCU|nr:hypothetical protein AX774_g733 [Zancudomyces culisetae]|eukprot:OMH85703.1 hypothetical protein AX774_g733 [Zancudomyces culisetae]
MFNSSEFVSGINSSCEVVSELVKKEKVGPFVHTTDMGKSLRKLAFDIVSVLYEHDHSKYLNTVVKLGLMDTFVPIVVTSLGMMITEKLTADEITHCFDLLIAGISHIKSAWGSGVKAGTDGGSGGKKTTSSGSAGLNEQKSANEDKAVVVERCDCLVESLKVTLQNAGGESKYEECLAKLADL